MRTVEKAPPGAALGELKAHLRIEDSVEDGLLAAWLLAATEAVEAELGQLLVEREVCEAGRLRGGILRLTLGPARAIVSVLERAGESEWVPVDADCFLFEDGWRAAVRLEDRAEGANLLVRYRAGIGVGWHGLPELLRHAVVRQAAHFHAHRDAVEAPGMPPAVRQLLSGQRARRLM